MKDRILTSFLKRQLVEGTELAAQSGLLALVPLAGDPPFRYGAEFRCKGLMKDAGGAVVEHDAWAISVTFPPSYLRGQVHVAEVLSYAGPVAEPFHPNIRPPFVCMEITPGMGLVEILYGLYDLLTWNLYATHDEGLNHEASQWARQQPLGRFPIDRRPLKRRAPGFRITDLAPSGAALQDAHTLQRSAAAAEVVKTLKR
jgi:hypothetical protein